MAPKPLPSDEKLPVAADDQAALETAKEPAPSASVRVVAEKAARPPPPPEEDDTGDDEPELELDDEQDEEHLVGFTAREAAGALATMYGFVKPYLAGDKKILTFVGFGVVVETLFNVIMPLSLKFLIDDALGEEDFQ